ncbi:uncharacterized protein LOC110734818 [Chenopodium quinoa]|uniref:uncharacterized protein LOC110734818 n=1 Tax=Chenopodium quinoa TaxID=63459 RepID=UPI000B777B73|nr:uncharacterized protein LOC110734818 [Chenopodium quinoa]
MGLREANAVRDVITGAFSINSILVKVLFDSGATYSFISKNILPKLLHCPKTIDDIDIPIELLTGGVVHCARIYKDIPIKIKRKEFRSNLIEFELGDLDIILGMDWLCRYNAEIRWSVKENPLENGSWRARNPLEAQKTQANLDYFFNEVGV